MSMPHYLHLLQSEDEYETALKHVRPFFENEPAPASSAARRFETLVASIEDYEAKHYPMPVVGGSAR